MSDDPYDNISAQLNDDESVENSSMISGSFVQEDDYRGAYSGASRKRKRAPEAVMVDQHHQLYGDSLLDYFVLSSENPVGLESGMPPSPPPGYQVDRAIDDQQHTAIHWAAAMADIPVVRLFLDLSADIGARNIRGETPLIRAVIFTNNYEKHTMGQLVDLLKDSICIHDNFSGTVLHHIAATTQSQSRKKVARYYFDVLLSKLSQMLPPPEFTNFLNARDLKGDTALHIVARNNARKCIRTLLGRGAAGDIPNNDRETADQLIHLARLQRHDEYALASSSPVPHEPSLTNGHITTYRTEPSLTIQKQSPKYSTAAACSFSDFFGPLASGKGLQIALALDSEVQDKSADLAEGQRLLHNVENERHLVRQRTFALMTGMDVGEDEQELEDLKREHKDLQAVTQSFLEQSQHRELHQEIRFGETQLPRSAHRVEINGANNNLPEPVLAEKFIAAHHLAGEQDKRRRMVESVVRAQATAGMSEKGEGCKELIAQLTGVGRDEVGGLVPELLEELEMSKTEGLAGAAGGVLLPKTAIATF